MNRPLLAAVLAVLSGSVFAEDFAPFSNNGALARGFALPALGRAFVASDESPAYSEFTLDFINEYHREGTPATEEILLDGESVRAAYGLRGGFAETWEWNLDVLVYVQGGGFGDDLIEGWHETFGLPNGGRESRAQDQYEYRYTRNGTDLLKVTESGTRFGDVTLGLGWQWMEASTLRLQFKLPTGDSERLSGGNAGVALWTDRAIPFAEDGRWSGYLSAGGSFNDEGEVLPQQQRSFIGFGGLGLRVRLYNSLQAYTQFYLHSPLYSDSELAPLTRLGAPAAFGLSWAVGEGAVFDLAFQEDLSVAASPDFSLRFGLRAR